MSREFLWYIPNTVDAGHRLDNVAGGWANLDQSTELAPYGDEAARVGDHLLPRLRAPVPV